MIYTLYIVVQQAKQSLYVELVEKMVEKKSSVCDII